MGASSTRGFASRLAPEDRDVIAAYAARASWPSGFLIYERGGRADGIFLVQRGRVILRGRAKSGRGFVPAILGPLETFGAEGLAPNASYVCDAAADGETETLFLTCARFRSLLREQPGHAFALIGQAMAERTACLERLQEMATLSVEQRLITAFVRLADAGVFLDAGGRLELTAARYRLLCEYVGATRESVSTVLGKLAAEELVDRSGSTMTIAPLSRLLEKLSPAWLDPVLAQHADAREAPLH